MHQPASMCKYCKIMRKTNYSWKFNNQASALWHEANCNLSATTIDTNINIYFYIYNDELFAQNKFNYY